MPTNHSVAQPVLLERTRQALATGRLPLAVFSDPTLYELEKERIFTHPWVFLTHESEIPQLGDYVVRYIANDGFIVTRDDDGQVHAPFNSCWHRGRQVCRAERGQAARQDVLRRVSRNWKLAHRTILLDQSTVATLNLAIFL